MFARFDRLLAGPPVSRRGSFTCFVLLLALAAVVPGQLAPVEAQAPAPGGIVETATSTVIRPRLTPSQIQALLPQRGPFVFPAPYNTRGVRLTNAALDCNGGDCLDYIGNNVYPFMNNSAGSNVMYIATRMFTSAGGTGPTLYRYNKLTGETVNLGAMFATNDDRYYATMEGWYFSASHPTTLYTNTWTQMIRYDILARTSQVVFDVTAGLGSVTMSQPHSSNDDKVHSFIPVPTDGTPPLRCAIYREATQQFTMYAAEGPVRDCHVDRSGSFLVMKEERPADGTMSNRIVDLALGTGTLLLASQGATRLLDTGFASMLGVDFTAGLNYAYRRWTFGPVAPGPVVYHTPAGFPPSMTHISWGSARPGAFDQQFACGGAVNRTEGPRANEIVCARLDGSWTTLVVAPVMTDLDAPGGGTSDVTKQPHGTVDPTGNYFMFVSNAGGSRLEMFLVHLPMHLIVNTGGGNPDAAPDISRVRVTGVTPTSAIVSWRTAQPADGFVEYGPTMTYGSVTPVNPSFTITHSETLAGLEPGRTYHFRVTSTNQQGVSRTSGDFTFRTPGPAQLTGVAVTNITLTSATVRWLTSQPASSVVDYGPTTAYGQTAAAPGNVMLHTVQLTGLSPNTLYHFRVRSQNAAGQTVTSPDGTFRTQSPKPMVFWVQTTHVTDDSATIVWVTEHPTRGRVEYGRTREYGQTTELDALSQRHSRRLLGLTPNATYHYRIVVVGQDGQTSYSRNFTFRTLPDRGRHRGHRHGPDEDGDCDRRGGG